MMPALIVLLVGAGLFLALASRAVAAKGGNWGGKTNGPRIRLVTVNDRPVFRRSIPFRHSVNG